YGSYPASGEALSLSLPPTELTRLEVSARNDFYSVGEPLVGSLFGGSSSPLAKSAALFVWAYFHTDGNSDAIAQIINEDFLAGEGSFRTHFGEHSRDYEFRIA